MKNVASLWLLSYRFSLPLCQCHSLLHSAPPTRSVFVRALKYLPITTRYISRCLCQDCTIDLKDIVGTVHKDSIVVEDGRVQMLPGPLFNL